jgi:hypothetical protein
MSVEKSYRVDRVSGGTAMQIRRGNHKDKVKTGKPRHEVGSKYKDRGESLELKKAVGYVGLALFCAEAALNSFALEMDERKLIAEAVDFIKRGGDANLKEARVKMEKVRRKHEGKIND